MYEPTGNAGPVVPSSPWMPDSDREILWAFLDTAPVALMAADDNRQIVRVNARWSDLTGYDADVAVGMRIDDLLAPESRPGIEMRWSDLLGTGLATARVVILRPDHVRVAVRYGAFANVLGGVHIGYSRRVSLQLSQEQLAWAPTLRRSVRLIRAFRLEQTRPDVF